MADGREGVRSVLSKMRIGIFLLSPSTPPSLLVLFWEGGSARCVSSSQSVFSYHDSHLQKIPIVFLITRSSALGLKGGPRGSALSVGKSHVRNPTQNPTSETTQRASSVPKPQARPT